MNDICRLLKDIDIEKVMNSKGYRYFTNGEYNINIIGVRKYNEHNIVTNMFDDAIIITYKTPANGWKKLIYPITTEPGNYYMNKQLGNPKGTAILVPNQYRGCYQLGKHNGKYKALVQVKPVQVYRDGNKDLIYDMNPENIVSGCFGINIHRSGVLYTPNKVDNYSAGCQVFQSINDYNAFIRLCEEQVKRYGNSFTYTLIEEKDLEYGK